jgi:ribose transport system permease protein
MSTVSAPVAATPLPEPTSRLIRFRRRQGWVAAVSILLVALFLWRYSQLPMFGGFELRTITAGTMGLAFLAMAQAVIVIGGGINLAIGAQMVLANCIAARLMEGQDLATSLWIALAVLVISVLVSTLIGWVIVVSGIPDIVVTLAASFVLAGAALFVLSGPGGGTPGEFQDLVVGGFSEPIPSILWIAATLLLFWLPIKRSRSGIAIYAVGSDRKAAFLAGVDVARTRVISYAVSGFLVGMSGLVTTAFTGSGEPRASIGAAATLNSVAAVVLGGVALMGGSGGLLGPVLAAMCLSLIPGIMLGLGVDPNLAEVARGVIIIVVVMVGGLLNSRRSRA